MLGTIVGGSILIGNTGHSSATPIDRTKKPWVYKEPKSMVLTQRDRLDLFRTGAANSSTICNPVSSTAEVTRLNRFLYPSTCATTALTGTSWPRRRCAGARARTSEYLAGARVVVRVMPR